MTTITAGSRIKIPCEVKPGPFSEEKLVSFETMDGIVSGFVEKQEVESSSSGFFITGVVKDVRDEAFIIHVKGSFFQTNGIAVISKSTACRV